MKQNTHSPALEPVEQSAFLKPRTLLFTTLAGAWCFPSLGAVVILLSQAARWSEVQGVMEFLREVRVEEWVAFGLLAVQAALIWLAFRNYRNEPVPLQVNDGEEVIDRRTSIGRSLPAEREGGADGFKVKNN
jgi:hypothetical protein